MMFTLVTQVSGVQLLRENSDDLLIRLLYDNYNFTMLNIKIL